MASQPQASRPYMPGYGIAGAEQGRGLLSWAWARERLASSRRYWISTTRPDGTPHAMPVWGVWVDDAFYFSTGRKSRKARNLAANPKCLVTTEGAEEAVIVEGVAKRVRPAAAPGPVAKAYKAKYQWKLDPSVGPIYAVRPRVAFAFIDRPDEFTDTATRWVFE